MASDEFIIKANGKIEVNYDTKDAEKEADKKINALKDTIQSKINDISKSLDAKLELDVNVDNVKQLEEDIKTLRQELNDTIESYSNMKSQFSSLEQTGIDSMVSEANQQLEVMQGEIDGVNAKLEGTVSKIKGTIAQVFGNTANLTNSTDLQNAIDELDEYIAKMGKLGVSEDTDYFGNFITQAENTKSILNELLDMVGNQSFNAESFDGLRGYFSAIGVDADEAESSIKNFFDQIKSGGSGSSGGVNDVDQITDAFDRLKQKTQEAKDSLKTADATKLENLRQEISEIEKELQNLGVSTGDIFSETRSRSVRTSLSKQINKLSQQEEQPSDENTIDGTINAVQNLQDAIQKAKDYLSEKNFSADGLEQMIAQLKEAKTVTDELGVKLSDVGITNYGSTLSSLTKKSNSFVDFDTYSKNYSNWLSQIKETLSTNYTNVANSDINRSDEGIVKFTANVQNAEGAWQKFTATVNSSGEIIKQTLRDVTEKQAYNIESSFDVPTENVLGLDEIESKSKQASQAINDLYGVVDKYTASVSAAGQLSISKTITDGSGQIGTLTAHFDNVDEVIQLIGTDADAAKAKLNEMFSSATFTTSNNSGINSYVQKLEELEDAYGNTEAFKNAQQAITDFENGTGSINNVKESMSALEAEVKKVESSVQSASDKINTGFYFSTSASLQSQTSVFGNFSSDSINQLRDYASEYERIQKELSNSYNTDTGEWLISDQEVAEKKQQLDEILTSFNNLMKQVKTEAGTNNLSKFFADIDTKKAQSQLDSFSQKLAGLGDNVSPELTEAQSQLATLADEIAQAAKTGDWDAITAAVQKFNAELNTANGLLVGMESSSSGTSWISSMISGLSSGWQSLTKIIGTGFITRELRSAASEMVSTVKEIDTSMAQLQIVTGATDSEMNEFLESSISLAKELGQSVSDVLDTVQTYSRLGYGLSDASELAEYSSILSNVAGVDIDDATSGLTSVVKGFDLEVSDVEHVSDVLIEVGQNYAVSASEILEAFEKSSAALAATGATFEESAAIIAAGNAAVQDAS